MPREDAAPRRARGSRETVSFEDAFDAEVRQEFGDLGPAATRVAAAVAAAASVVAATAVVVAAVASAEAPDLTDLDPGVEHTELPNGLRIVTETMPEARSVTLGAWVRVGGRDEPAELSGASHFLEHLLFKGTEDRSARQIAEAVDSVGGEMNAFTAREHTAYYARLPHAEGQPRPRDPRRRAHRAGPAARRRSRPSAR